MTHGSLFSGIGGFDLAAQWMGWENVFHCEIEPIPRNVLQYYWPDAISYEDITKTDFTIHRGSIDILTGGFPCQPFSAAGKRKGTEDDRHLWPQMLRAIREIKPTWIVGENVRGLINWSEGLVFEQVCTDLEAQGYDVQPFLLPACSIDAPHKRDRIWFIAYTQSTERKQSSNTWTRGRVPTSIYNGHASNTGNQRLQGGQFVTSPDQETKVRGQQPSGSTSKFCKVPHWQDFPTQPPVCSRNDGISTELDGITLPKHRRESIKAYGNAVVPQLVLQIFRAIASMI